MYKGKFSKKNNRRLAPWAALALALVLALSVGGTVAYLFTNTSEVVNTFTPGKTGISIEEKTEGPKKTEITVKNDGDVPVYVRVMLVATYHNSEGQVCGQHSSVAVPGFGLNFDYWVPGDAGVYYYKTAIPAKDATENLISGENGIMLKQAEDGCVMHVEVLAQSIQAEPADAVKDAWGVDPTTLGSN